MKTGHLINIFIVVFIDMLGFGLIMPLLPYYARTFDASPFVIGLLVASFAAASLLGAPLIGRLSDRFGRRPMLLLSIAGTFVGYLVLGFAQPIGHLLANTFAPKAIDPFTIATLFFSRIIDGLTAGNTTVAQAYISDVTDETSRTVGFGVIGSAFGLGYMIGPAAGGLLSRWGYAAPAFAAAALAFLNLVSIFLRLPESLGDEQRGKIILQKRVPVSLRALLTALTRPKVGPLLWVRFCIMLAYAIFWSIFALYAQIKLGLSAQSTGFVLTCVGIYSVLVQGVGIRLLVKRFNENNLIKASLWLLLLGLIGWALTPSLWVMLPVILFLAGGGWTVNTIVTSAITRAVAPEEVGGMLGISTALEAISRVIAPMAGSFMLGSAGAWAPGVTGAVVTLCAIGLAYRHLITVKMPVVAPAPIEPE